MFILIFIKTGKMFERMNGIIYTHMSVCARARARAHTHTHREFLNSYACMFPSIKGK